MATGKGVWLFYWWKYVVEKKVVSVLARWLRKCCGVPLGAPRFRVFPKGEAACVAARLCTRRLEYMALCFILLWSPLPCCRLCAFACAFAFVVCTVLSDHSCRS